MAKPLSEKAKIIREAIQTNPDMGNTALAAELSERHTELEFKPQDVAAQRGALRRAAAVGEGEEEDNDDAAFGGFEDEKEQAPAEEAPKRAASVASAPRRPEVDGRQAIAPAAVQAAAVAGGLTPEDFRTLAAVAKKVGGWQGLKIYVDTFAEGSG